MILRSQLKSLSWLKRSIHLTKQLKHENSAASSNDEKTTHFGFENVTQNEKAEKGWLWNDYFIYFIINFFSVHNVFENVASSYDVMNDAMSGGIHRLWKDYFVSNLNPRPGISLLDVAGGTGNYHKFVIELRFELCW